MDPNSMEAAEARDIDSLYESIGSDPYMLDKADEIPFANSPLHVAASTGQTRLAMEIMNLKASLARKLNPDGLSPLHLALLNGHYETVKRLIKMDKELIRVKGRERLTPLHYAAKTDDRVDILAEFLCACPESIEDLTVRDETVLHIAVKNCSMRALGVLMGWIRKSTCKHWVIKIQDERGNTILHTAVFTSEPQIVKSVVRCCYGLNINEKNLEGDTPFDVAGRLAPGFTRTKIERILHSAGASKSSSLANDCSLANYLISRGSCVESIFRMLFSMGKGMSLELRNIVLVIAVLISTATFQAALSPLGGSGGGGGGGSGLNNILLHNGSHINVTIWMSSASLLPTTNISHINATIFTSMNELPKEASLGIGGALTLFYALNTLAFITSIAMIIVVLPFQVFYLVHASLLVLTLSYVISFQVTQTYEFNAIIGSSSMAIFLPIYSALYFPMVVQYLCRKDKPFPFFMSNIQRKRLRMLQRLVMN